MATPLAKAASAAKTWLHEAMLPLWTSAGFDDRSGQFVEALTPEGAPMDLPRRTLVQARQMFVCCAGGRLGWRRPWREHAAAAGEALLARGRTDTGDWIYSFDAKGAPADSRLDLYTQAFVILGFAEAGRALGRGEFVAAAVASRENLQARWRHTSGGFAEGEIAPHPGRQNPHMHLLEAALALYAATGAAEDLAWADDLAGLFVTQMLQDGSLIPEAFDEAWRPIQTAGVAPGHQFEWAWLLDRLQKAGGAAHPRAGAELAKHGERQGVDSAGFAVDTLWFDGSVKEPTARLWPQAERLKAALVRRERDPAAATQADQALAALNAYLEVPLAGAWRDVRTPEGGWRDGPAPASSGYHIIGAYEALIEAASEEQA